MQYKSKTWFSRPLPCRILGNPPPTQKALSRRAHLIIKWWFHRLIHLNETPYRIAMGSACGIFCSALPLFGQTFIGMVAARILRASILASLPWSWISNPLTTLPMWYGGYRLGIWMLSGQQKPLSASEVQQLVENFDQMAWLESLSILSGEFMEALEPLWLGCIVMGLIMAAPGFVMVYYIAQRLLRQLTYKRQKDL